jgi:hypothetical protein
VPLGIIAVVYRLDAIRSFTGEVAAAQGVQLTIIDQNGGVLIDPRFRGAQRDQDGQRADGATCSRARGSR